jgi:DNA polymerase V
MFALVDCNNFYCSCERVFQPQLGDKPLIVLSNNDGCSISRSEEAKALGIEMGTPYHYLFEVIAKHGVQVRSSNYTLYDDMSGRVMRTLARFVPQMEVYSIDEAFLDMHGMAQHHDLQQLALTIRETVRRNQGIPVCIGMAPTKTLAKLANRYAKKVMRETGVYLADTEEKRMAMLEWAQVKDIWGVGSQYAKMLNDNGYHTAAQLITASEEFIRDKMTVVGHRLIKELKGVPCIPWEFEAKKKQGIISSRSFGELITEKKVVQNAVAEYASRVAEKLRIDGSVTSRVHVFVNTNPYKKEHAQYHQGVSVDLLMGANDTPTVVKTALRALDTIWRTGYAYMKAGVMAVNISSADAVQASMWEQTDKSRLKAAMQALDGINRTYGKHTVKVASLGPQQKAYEMRRAHLSKCYTTKLSDIVTTSF